MSSPERKPKVDILSSIDDVLADNDRKLGNLTEPEVKEVPKAVSKGRVRKLTNFIRNINNDKERIEKGKELSELKDVAFKLLHTKSENKIFPGSDELLNKSKLLQDRHKKNENNSDLIFKTYERSRIENELIYLRDGVLAHVLSADTGTLSKLLQGKVKILRERYTALEDIMKPT